MKKDESFAEYVVYDILNDFPNVHFKYMFGSFGIFQNKKMIGIVSDGAFYLKTNKKSLEEYKREGLMTFKYKKGKKYIEMSYYEVPEEILENREEITKRVNKSLKLK